MAIGNLPLWQSTGVKSASTLVKTGSGGVSYIFPTASASGLVAIYDGVDTNGINLTGSISLTAATKVIVDLGFATGCFIQLVSGTATFFVAYV